MIRSWIEAMKRATFIVLAAAAAVYISGYG